MLHSLPVICPTCHGSHLNEIHTCSKSESKSFQCKECETTFTAQLLLVVGTTAPVSLVAAGSNIPTQAADLRKPLIVHIDDTIRLQAKSSTGRELLAQYGEWWKVKIGSKSAWTLIPVPGAGTVGERLGRGKIPHQQILQKDNQQEMHLLVVDVCPFPDDFKRSNYK